MVLKLCKPYLHEIRLIFLLTVIVFMLNYLIFMDSLNRTENSTTNVPLELSSNPTKTITRSLSNVVNVLNRYVLFFNRLPSSGSEMFILLIQWLHGPNNFKHIRLKDARVKLMLNDQEKLVNEVIEYAKTVAVPLIFDKNVHFVNFTQFDQQSPTFFSLVRNPTDKIISNYYYETIHAKSKSNHTIWKVSRVQEKYATLAKCITHEHMDCKLGGRIYQLTVPYFCGHHPKCSMVNHPWALETAKANVEKFYGVVGVLEEMNATVKLLATHMSYFFKGVENLYATNLYRIQKSLEDAEPRETKQYLTSYFKKRIPAEYEFYNWLKQRLFRQLNYIYQTTNQFRRE